MDSGATGRWDAGSVRLRVAYCTGLLVLALVVYLPVLGSYFVGDDFEGILEVVRRGSFGSFEHAGGNFRPVAWATLTIDHWIWGDDPTGFHLFNVVAHAIAGALAALVASMLIVRLRPDTAPQLRRRAAVVAGVLFVVLPSHTEAVSWIAGRGDVVMTAACLVAIAAWIGSADGGGASMRLASCAALAAALFTKESAIAVPLVISWFEVVDAASRRGPVSMRERLTSGVRVAATAWPLYLTVVMFLVVRRVVRGNFVDGYGDEYERVGPVRLIAKAAIAVARSVLPGMSPVLWAVVLPLGGAALVAAVVSVRRAEPRVGSTDVALLAFVAGALLVCVLPMIPAGVSARNTGGERLVYLPSVFGVIAVSWLLALVVESRRRVGVAMVAGVLAVGVGALLVVNAVWVEAGEASEQLVTDAGRWREGDRVVLLNSPDSLRGAYVARNAMAGSMALIHGWRSPEVLEVAGVLVTGSSDDVEVGPGSCSRCLRLRLLETDSSFVRVAAAGSEWAIGGIVATQVDAHTLEVRFDVASSGPDYDVWYLDEGRLVRAALPPE